MITTLIILLIVGFGLWFFEFRNWTFTKPVVYHRSSWLLKLFPDWVEAFTFGRHICFRKRLLPYHLYIHENVHVRQYRDNGIIKFLWIYFWVDRHLPYKERRFEVEAYEYSGPYENSRQPDMEM